MLAGATEVKAKQVLTKMGMVALNGWSNLMPEFTPPLILTDIGENLTNVKDLLRLIEIERAVADTASRQGLEMSKLYLTDDMLKDIVRLDLALAPGGGLPVFSDLQHGMCILNTLHTTVSQVSEWQLIEENYRETKKTRVPLQPWK